MTGDFAQFTNPTSKFFSDYGEICDEIKRRTDNNVNGETFSVSSEVISIKIYSERFLNLTLVDLPGFVEYNAANKNLGKQIEDLVKPYVEKESTIILAISNAPSFSEGSKALGFAQSFDPDGEHTMAVFTKLDDMGEGTSFEDIINDPRKIRAQLGIIGVVNRSQEDIDSGKDIAFALKKEQDFLAKNYKKYAHEMGTKYLIEQLRKNLEETIRRKLPDLKAKIEKELKEKGDLLKKYGTHGFDKEKALEKIIENLAKIYTSSIEGRNLNPEAMKESFHGGGDIHEICFGDYRKDMEAIDPLKDLTDENILTLTKNCNGTSRSILLNDNATSTLVRAQIDHLKTPTEKCLVAVHDKLKSILEQCLSVDMKNVMENYPALKWVLSEKSLEFLDECRNDSTSMIDNLFAVEKAYINKDHPRFRDDVKRIDEEMRNDLITGTTWLSSIALPKSEKMPFINNFVKEMPELLKKSWFCIIINKILRKSALPNPVQMLTTPVEIQLPKILTNDIKMQHEINLHKQLIKSYMNVVKNNLEDLIPKSLMHFFVFASSENLCNMLKSKIKDSNTCLDKLFNESADFAKKRDLLSQQFKVSRI